MGADVGKHHFWHHSGFVFLVFVTRVSLLDGLFSGALCGSRETLISQGKMVITMPETRAMGASVE